MTELSAEEILAAANRAAVYPEGYGFVYIPGYGTDADAPNKTEKLLLNTPNLVFFG